MLPALTTTLLLLGASAMPAPGGPAPSWESTCKFGNASVSIVFASKSGDVTEDDMTIEIRWPGGNRSPLNLPERWYRPKSFVSNAQCLCSNIGAFELGSNVVVLLVPWDGRPGWDHASAILLDPIRGRVLDLKDDIGELGEPPMAIARPGRIELLLHDEWMLQPGDGEFAVPRWRILSVQGGKLITRWRE